MDYAMSFWPLVPLLAIALAWLVGYDRFSIEKRRGATGRKIVYKADKIRQLKILRLSASFLFSVLLLMETSGIVYEAVGGGWLGVWVAITVAVVLGILLWLLINIIANQAAKHKYRELKRQLSSDPGDLWLRRRL